jgi:hypothetical protein
MKGRKNRPLRCEDFPRVLFHPSPPKRHADKRIRSRNRRLSFGSATVQYMCLPRWRNEFAQVLLRRTACRARERHQDGRQLVDVRFSGASRRSRQRALAPHAESNLNNRRTAGLARFELLQRPIAGDGRHHSVDEDLAQPLVTLLGEPAVTAYCGTRPSRPTLTRPASSVPSGLFTAAVIVMAAPGLSSLLSPTS